MYKYDGDGSSFASYSQVVDLSNIPNVPDAWDSIDAAFTNSNGVMFWFNNATGTVLPFGEAIME